jgi:hypothetical protein
MGAECVDVSSGNDRDHDGVPDAADNCPDLANPDQGNEDGDMFGDACDPCPPIANNMPSDSDNDGVADACDPHATMADHLIMFEGFHHGVPAGWTMTGGTVVQSGDSLVITPNTGMLAVLAMPFTSTKAITVSAGVSPVMLPAPTVNGAGGVVAATDGMHVLACELDDNQGAQALVAEESQLGTSSMKPWSFQAQVPYTLSLTWDLVDAVSCDVTNAGASTTTTITLPAALPASWHQVGVYAIAMPMRIDWVMVTSL